MHAVVIINIQVLLNQVVGIQNAGIDLGFALLYTLKISVKTLMVVLSESRTVVVHRIRRNLCIVNQAPLTRGHQTLGDVDVLTQRGQHLTIGTRAQLQCADCLSGKYASLRRAGVLRGHPLCQQRHGNVLVILGGLHCADVLGQGFSNQFPHQRFAFSAHQHEQRVEAVEVRDQLDILGHNRGLNLCQPAQADTESATLTQTTLTDVAGIKEHFGCKQVVFVKSCGKLLADFLLSTRTQCANLREQIQQSALCGRIVSKSAIFGSLNGTFTIHSISKIHFFITPFTRQNYYSSKSEAHFLKYLPTSYFL